MLSNKNAQAATEFAIIVSLVIVAFAFLINYSVKLNNQQSCIQQAFRLALSEAREADNSASYTKVVFRRMPNVSSPMELGQLQSVSSSSNVLWADGKSRNEDETPKDGVSKYQLNEAEAIDIPKPEYEYLEGQTKVSMNTFTNTVDSTTTFTKQESASGDITTAKTLNATDTLSASVDIDGTAYPFEHYLGANGKYYDQSTSLSRSRSME
ncbi:MAG: hypothetical protein KJ710_01100 [Candidatus Omnitrophica bacterium]|nr:hypothetical protein [Candidatus Omnitrophota bacterium]MBU1922847.1 hypothetical protein [Candidatus Omnitrophota bacterium]